MRRLKEKLHKCIFCKNDFFGSSRFCSENCRIEHEKARNEACRNSEKYKLMQYKSITKNYYKKKLDDFLILRFRQTIIKFGILEELLKERKIDLDKI